MRKIILMIFFPLATSLMATPSYGECVESTCVEVHVQDGKIVIEGKRNGATTTPKPAATRRRVIISKPTISSKTTSSRATRSPVRAKRVRTVTKSPSAASTSPSLSDRILQSLPTLQVGYQPEGKVLTRVPVVFFTDLPTFFNRTYKILGVPVRIDAHPKSLWSFGDGSILLTDKPGKPYPSTDITHSYSVPGTYLVKVETIWTGSYTIAGVTQMLDGAIRQTTAVDVKVVGAGTRFVGK